MRHDQTQQSSPKEHRVWVLYHWLGHYRQAVCEELIRSPSNRYEFWGSPTSYGQGIKVVTALPEGRFRPTKTYRAAGFYPQPEAVRHAIFGRYDVVIIHAGGRWPTMWIAAISARLRGKRVYYWMQGWTRRDSWPTRLFKWIYYGIADGMLLYGHFGKCLGIEAGFDPDRMHVIYNSLDVESQLEAVRNIGTDDVAAVRLELFPDRPDVPIVATLSRLTTPKRLELLVDACAILEQRGTRINLLVAGDGPLRSELESRSVAQGVHANFVGAIYEEQRIAELLKASAVGVVPGPIGLFVMHAMVFGLPVISNDCFEGQGPEFEAIVPGVTGDFFKDGDAESLADKLLLWLSGNGENDTRRRVAEDRITTFYHPRTQRAIIDRAIGGAPANDLVMARWSRGELLREDAS